MKKDALSALAAVLIIASVLSLLGWAAHRAQQQEASDAELDRKLAKANRETFLKQRTAPLEARIDQLERAVAELQADLDVAHQRIDDIKLAAEAVVATCPGRARLPYVPTRTRPCVEKP